jgi:hypothetical protein
MKKLFFLLYIVLFCFASSCDKNEEPIPEKEFFFWGETTALQNGESWEACPFSDFDLADGEKFNLVSDVLINNNFLVESLGFIKIPFSLGTYTVTSELPINNNEQVGGFFSFQHDDEIRAGYEVTEADNSNFLTITSYDSTTLELKGTFDLTFLKTSGSSEYPDTVRFTNGEFHTKIIER